MGSRVRFGHGRKNSREIDRQLRRDAQTIHKRHLKISISISVYLIFQFLYELYLILIKQFYKTLILIFVVVDFSILSDVFIFTV